MGGEDDIPLPRPGIDEQFDETYQKVNEAKSKLHAHLVDLKNILRSKTTYKNQPYMNKVKFAHNRYRYEVEIPTELVKTK